MNADILKNAGIDYDGGVKRFLGRAPLYLKTLAKFPKNDTMDRVRADYEKRDREALLQDSHELKGMCGNMSMTKLYLAADAVVTLLRAGGATDEKLAAAMDGLEKEYEIAKEAVLAATEEL